MTHRDPDIDKMPGLKEDRLVALGNREQPFEMTIAQVMAAVAAIEKEGRP